MPSGTKFITQSPHLSLHISSQWGSSGHVMGLDISARAKQKQQEYTKQSLAGGVEEKIRIQICRDKQEALEGH